MVTFDFAMKVEFFFYNNYFLLSLVPGAPSAVKALLMTPDSILVSWKAPELPNGIVNQYTVYIQEGSVIFIPVSLVTIELDIKLLISCVGGRS